MRFYYPFFKKPKMIYISRDLKCGWEWKGVTLFFFFFLNIPVKQICLNPLEIIIKLNSFGKKMNREKKFAILSPRKIGTKNLNNNNKNVSSIWYYIPVYAQWSRNERRNRLEKTSQSKHIGRKNKTYT